MGFSTVTLCGNVGQDPELAYSGSGTAWTRARVAVTEWNGKEEETHWITCILFGKRAEHWARRVKKGSAVTIQGRLSEEKSDDKQYDGRLKVVVERFEVTRNWATGDADDRADYDGDGRDQRDDPRSQANRRADRGRDDNDAVGLEGSAPAGDDRKRNRGKRGGGGTEYQGGDGRGRRGK
jgi:single-strand DNA-binding protein